MSQPICVFSSPPLPQRLAVKSTFPSLPGLADADENCKRFVDRCMPEAFKKASDETCRDFSLLHFQPLLREGSHFFFCFAFARPVVDQQRRAQVGHRDPRGDLQHADAAGGAGGREGQAGPSTCQPDGSPDHGGLTHCVTAHFVDEIFFRHSCKRPF